MRGITTVSKTLQEVLSVASQQIVPLTDHIVIKFVPAEETLASGLVIPDTAKEKPQQGDVIAVGPGRVDEKGTRVPIDVNVGDRIIYAKYSGYDFKLDGNDLLILQEKDILAKLQTA